MNLFNTMLFLMVFTTMSHDQTVFAIVGGHGVPNCPFFAVVQTLTGQFCGGTFVAPDAVVTAAHCLFLHSEERWALFEEVRIIKSDFSKLVWDNDVEMFLCDHYVYHEAFDIFLNASQFDIAVIKLDHSLDLTKAQNGLLQPCPKNLEYTQGFVIGMGAIRTGPDEFPDTLRGLWLYRVWMCHEIYKDVPVDFKSQLCFGTGWRGTCRGDGGSPIINWNYFHAESTCIIGIVSFRDSPLCDHHSIPTVFTRAGYFADWIGRRISTSSSILFRGNNYT